MTQINVEAGIVFKLCAIVSVSVLAENFGSEPPYLSPAGARPEKQIAEIRTVNVPVMRENAEASKTFTMKIYLQMVLAVLFFLYKCYDL